jgi:hypothetical protein
MRCGMNTASIRGLNNPVMQTTNRTILRLVATSLALIIFLAGCASSRKIEYDTVDVIRAEAEVAEEALLDVGILIFDPGVEEDQEEPDGFVFPDVRRAEARYMPYHLKKTLEDTGHWGSVWVLPERSDAVDILIWGRVDHSDGLEVKLRVGAWDSTGKEWINKAYKDRIPEKAYSKYRDQTRDPYQDVYNEIANDLLNLRDDLTTKDLAAIRNVAELRFAANLVPAAFGDHLVEDDGEYSIRRLPAEDDPMIGRMRAVREREYTFVDTLNEYYASLYYEMSPPYEDWRKMSREETLNYQELKRSARMRQLLGLAAILGAVAYEANGGGNSAITNTAIMGGIAGVSSGFNKSAEAKLHGESIKELGSSFEAEAEPLIIEIEGQTHRLTGTVEQQYKEWRRLLREIYVSETGFEELPEPIQGNAQSTAD